MESALIKSYTKAGKLWFSDQFHMEKGGNMIFELKLYFLYVERISQFPAHGGDVLVVNTTWYNIFEIAEVCIDI